MTFCNISGYLTSHCNKNENSLYIYLNTAWKSVEIVWSVAAKQQNYYNQILKIWNLGEYLLSQKEKKKVLI